MGCKMTGNYPENYEWDDQEIVDLEFHDIVMNDLLETDVKADRNARSVIDRIRSTLFPIQQQTYFFVQPFEIFYIEDDDDAI